MSVQDKSELNSTWREDDGSVVRVPDSFEDMNEYISSLIKAAQIANVNTEMSEFGHEDVTVKVESETDGRIRELTFIVVVDNWREHIGGKSAYSEQDMVTYRVDDGDNPDRLMHSTGSFYHKLENRISDLFGSTPFHKPMFELQGFDDSEVRYSGTLTMHRYD